VVLPPLSWQLSAVYLVKMHENKGVMESFGRTSKVMKGNYWWTWAIFVCASLAVGFIGLVFTIPQVIYTMVLRFSHLHSAVEDISIGFFIVASVCTFCASLVRALLTVINGFHYFSLAEKKGGEGLMEKINEIGNAPINNVENQY
jgi:hypothetical protein